MKTIAAIEILPVIRRICADRDWRLLSYRESGVNEQTFADRVRQRLLIWQREEDHAEITDRQIERAVIHEYCVLLHQAVGMEGTAVQERALIELWNYVTPTIRTRLPDRDRAEACANQVLCIIWQKRSTVRNPGSFLSWATMVAKRAANAEATANKREITTADRWDDEDDDAEGQDSATSGLCGEPGTARVDDAPDDLTWWETLIRRCLARMRDGAEIVMGLVFGDESVVQLAARLRLSAANVYVIKFRAFARLRRCRPLLDALGRTLEAPEGADRCI